jgi:hypothetical protein
MDINNIEKRLKKIHTVLEVFKEDNKISDIERDLLLGYVRELYDIIKESKNNFIKDEIVLHPLEGKTISKITEEKFDEPKIDLEPKKIVESFVDKENSIVDVKEKIKNIEEPKVTIEEQKQEKQVEIPKIQTKIKSQSNNIDEDIIFEEDKVQDLSERLSMTKISDIGKMGINERMHIVKELFQNNTNSFIEFISKLNSLNSYEEAKVILKDTSRDRNWTVNEDKIKVAQQFVKQVRRKFL